MTKIIVDQGVPLPNKYPFMDMRKGDSFLLPDPTKRTAVTVAAKRYGDKHGMKFTVRKVLAGFRCWRTE